MGKIFREFVSNFGLAHKGGVPPSFGMKCFLALKAMFDGKHLMFGSFFLPLHFLLPHQAKGQTSVSGTDRGTQEKITTSSAAASQQKAEAPVFTVSDKTSVRSKGLSPEECMKIVQEDAYKRNPELQEHDLAQAEKRKSQAQQRVNHKKDVQSSAPKVANPVREKTTLARQHAVQAKAKKSDSGQGRSSGKNSKLLAQRQSGSSKRTKSATHKSPSRPKAKNLQGRERILQSNVVQVLDPPAYPPIDPSFPKTFARIQSSSQGLKVSAEVHESLVHAGPIELVVRDGQSGNVVYYGEMIGGVTSPDRYVRFEVTCPASRFKNNEIYLFRVNQWGPFGGRQLTGFPSSVYFKENDPDASVHVEKSPVKHQTTLRIVPVGDGAKFVVKTTEKPGPGEDIYVQVYDSATNFYGILPLKVESKEGAFTVYSYLEEDMSMYLSPVRVRRFRVYLGDIPVFSEIPRKQLCACYTDLSHFPFYRNHKDESAFVW